MVIPPNLPKRKPIKSNEIGHNTYKLKDFIGTSNEFIRATNTGTILVDYETVVNNLDLLNKIVSILSIYQINCLDYESALFLEEKLKDNIDLALVDDYKNKDRSYIDTTKFINHNFYIPLSYFMWGIKFENSCNIRCLRYLEYDNMTSIEGDNVLYRKTLERLKEIIGNIKDPDLTDLDKCILVSNYLQSKIQYVGGGLKSYADKVYLIEAEADEVTTKKVSSVSSVIEENYGLCMAIANATTLLLNNPELNVNVRSLHGDSHVWNVATIEEKQYYMDNTWAITRNKNRVDGALKASKFSEEYLLFGAATSNNIGHHNSQCYSNGELEKNDYNKEEILKRIRTLSKKHEFDNYSKNLAFKSKVEES